MNATTAAVMECRAPSIEPISIERKASRTTLLLLLLPGLGRRSDNSMMDVLRNATKQIAMGNSSAPQATVCHLLRRSSGSQGSRIGNARQAITSSELSSPFQRVRGAALAAPAAMKSRVRSIVCLRPNT